MFFRSGALIAVVDELDFPGFHIPEQLAGLLDYEIFRLCVFHFLLKLVVFLDGLIKLALRLFKLGLQRIIGL